MPAPAEYIEYEIPDLRVRTCIYIHLYVCIYTHTHTYILIYAYMWIYVHAPDTGEYNGEMLMRFQKG